MKAPIFAYTYTEVLRTLRKRLREPAPARAQILSGPRQVGKTTLLGEIAAEWPGRPVSPVWRGPPFFLMDCRPNQRPDDG